MSVVKISGVPEGFVIARIGSPKSGEPYLDRSGRIG